MADPRTIAEAIADAQADLDLEERYGRELEEGIFLLLGTAR